ncbi:CheR family methyltransferase [Mucilaginibacter sp.]|jgi:two-component system CheB/CheR fusion protein|uniref:CheR family methyltransferase n=1 Tax=Mucilaginibacter sp. TaxID=1882438 RepID=UPI002C5D427E|nr:CheR family methyltransferase [Mucilaginibacter sp.]HTI61044.1 CheR family methyltransferase [Mucilaginibacter sp.]
MKKKIDNKQYIIAIGASAGGLEAISAFFDYTPLDAVSYILIQHLAYDYKSMMAQILARHSKLEVMEVSDNMKIESNKVYLIPSANFMTIKNGTLFLSDKKDKQKPYMTIDHFFTSLAKDRGNKAIGVILSGTGNDGSKGIAAIKELGGVVIIQDPDSANYSEMPMAAIATGYADRVLSPEAMPKVIEDYVNDGVLELLIDDKDHEINEEKLTDMIGLIKANLPLDFSDYKRPTILRRIKRRMVQHNFSRVEKYYEFLKSNPKEIEALAKDFLISVTSFFRDPDAFKIIEKKVIPDIINHKIKGEILKIWVAGCATGEEAYSLAIFIREYLNKVKKDIEVKIFATDINKAALDIASKGIYDDKIEKMVSKERLRHFFTQNGASYKVKPEVRKMLVFAQHDLAKNPPYCNVDLISCRNVLIYMNAALQKKVLAMLHFGLKKDGYLFLGPSESLVILKSDFSEINNKWNILKSNKIGRTLKFETFSSSVIDGIKTTTIEINKKPIAPVSQIAIAEKMNFIALEESGLRGICTDENLMVIQTFGDPSIYLKDEMFNFNLNELMPDNIAITFKAAVHKAFQLNQKVTLNNLNFVNKNSSSTKTVNLVICPFHTGQPNEKLLLILFKEKKSKAKNENLIKDSDIDQLTREHVIILEKELAESKHKLELAYELIDTSNENMQSFNEELLSANEEMQSANEELQSVNEELQTINKEHLVTNGELTESNDDLNNYFRSNVNGQLFVDHDLLLRKYSPGAVKHINVLESDIGRPLSNITTNIKFESLIEDIKQVILNGETVTKEAESSEGRTYQVMTMPYIKKSNKQIDGAIISFYDITELKELLKELDVSNKNLDISNKSLDERNKSLLRINEDLNNFVFGASHDLKAPILNIEMMLTMLNDKMDNKDPEVMKLSAMMNKSVINFKSIINDLGKVGSIESEQIDDNQNENFSVLFNEIRETISEKVRMASATFTTDFREKEVRFAKKNLRSIMLNLITNSIKFHSSERKPEIMIKTEKSDIYTLLTVTDNGIGISKDKINYVFDMYQRFNNDKEGSGIGLYLIKKIVNASGGKIEVESEVGKGSSFKIFFKNSK